MAAKFYEFQKPVHAPGFYGYRVGDVLREDVLLGLLKKDKSLLDKLVREGYVKDTDPPKQAKAAKG